MSHERAADNAAADASRILIVDDDVRLLRLLAIRLRRTGFEIETAESARQALVALPRFRPHVVVTDMRMSGMDGMTLFNTIHAHQPTLPVIILTAHGTIPDAVDAAQRGVFAYLTKPFDSEQLTQVIERALRVAGATASGGRDDAQW